MKPELLKKKEVEEIFDHLFDHGFVNCGHEGVENFIDELGELLHYDKQFKKIKGTLRNNILFKQRFEEEIKRIILEGNY